MNTYFCSFWTSFWYYFNNILQKSDIVLRFPLLLPVRPHTYPPTSSLTFVSLAIHSSLGHQSGGEIITMYIDSWHRRFRSDVILEHFQAHAGRRMGPGSFQNMTLEHFHAHAAEWAQEAPRTWLWSISKPTPQNGSKKPPESNFEASSSPGRRMGPGSSQHIIWSISKPRLQNVPRKLPESNFEAFPSPGRRMCPGSS